MPNICCNSIWRFPVGQIGYALISDSCLSKMREISLEKEKSMAF